MGEDRNDLKFMVGDRLLGSSLPSFIDVDDVVPMPLPQISPFTDLSFEAETIVTPNQLRKLLGIDVEPEEYPTGCWTNDIFIGFKCAGPTMVQVRKHRKKRINKKWAKKYGYKFVLVPKYIESVSLIKSDEGEIDILGKTDRGYRG